MIKLQEFIGHILFWLSWPAAWVYLKGSHRSRMIIISEDHILLVKNWISPKGWSLPGGGIHGGEEPAAGASRELREETGLQLDPKLFKLVVELPVRSYGHSFHAYGLEAKIDGQPAIKRQRLELTAAEWVLIEKLSEKHLTPGSKQIVETWSKRQKLVK